MSRVVGGGASQADMCDALETNTIVDRALDGHPSVVIAYGPSQTGKSYTLLGDEGNDRGLIPRVVEDLFRRRQPTASPLPVSIETCDTNGNLQDMADSYRTSKMVPFSVARPGQLLGAIQSGKAFDAHRPVLVSCGPIAFVEVSNDMGRLDGPDVSAEVADLVADLSQGYIGRRRLRTAFGQRLASMLTATTRITLIGTVAPMVTPPITDTIWFVRRCMPTGSMNQDDINALHDEIQRLRRLCGPPDRRVSLSTPRAASGTMQAPSAGAAVPGSGPGSAPACQPAGAPGKTDTSASGTALEVSMVPVGSGSRSDRTNPGPSVRASVPLSTDAEGATGRTESSGGRKERQGPAAMRQTGRCASQTRLREGIEADYGARLQTLKTRLEETNKELVRVTATAMTAESTAFAQRTALVQQVQRLEQQCKAAEDHAAHYMCMDRVKRTNGFALAVMMKEVELRERVAAANDQCQRLLVDAGERSRMLADRQAGRHLMKITMESEHLAEYRRGIQEAYDRALAAERKQWFQAKKTEFDALHMQYEGWKAETIAAHKTERTDWVHERTAMQDRLTNLSDELRKAIGGIRYLTTIIECIEKGYVCTGRACTLPNTKFDCRQDAAR